MATFLLVVVMATAEPELVVQNGVVSRLLRRESKNLFTHRITWSETTSVGTLLVLISRTSPWVPWRLYTPIVLLTTSTYYLER